MSFAVRITGATEVGVKLDQLPARLRAGFLERITALTTQLHAEVVGAEPDRTGRLRNTTVMRVEDTPGRIRGRVFVDADFAKAGALEYGAHGTANVRAHAERLDHLWSRFIAPMTVMVAEHSRQLNIAEHRFMRGSLEELEAEITADLQEVIDEAGEL
jgi:hypothetical protein